MYISQRLLPFFEDKMLFLTQGQLCELYIFSMQGKFRNRSLVQIFLMYLQRNDFFLIIDFWRSASPLCFSPNHHKTCSKKTCNEHFVKIPDLFEKLRSSISTQQFKSPLLVCLFHNCPKVRSNSQQTLVSTNSEGNRNFAQYNKSSLNLKFSKLVGNSLIALHIQKNLRIFYFLNNPFES